MQILLLSALGYFLVKRNLLGAEGLNALSRLVIEITLPAMIFCKLIKEFDFDIFPNWWAFPLLSILITIAGLALGAIFALFFKGTKQKLQFLSLIAFQNSGYLPLALIGTLLAKEQADTMLIYLFLFLMGFNLVVWSLGVYMLTFTRAKRFELGSLFSPPVLATVLSLVLIFFGWHSFIPDALFGPLNSVGNCTLALALFVVGGNLARIRLSEINKKVIFYIILIKLILMPLVGLWLILKLNVPQLAGLLILIQLAMPPATSLSVIISHYKKEDLFISQGIFFGHLASIVTLPVFLSLYFWLVMIK